MITCIMPTTVKRRKLWPAALRTFARQTFDEAKLLIGLDAVDIRDHHEGISLIAQIEALANQLGILPRVEVAIFDERSLGAKRNALCRTATTPWIAFWDDDDWHAPRRLEHTFTAIDQLQTRALFAVRAPILLGSRTMLIHEIVDPRRRTFTFEWSGKEPYMVGGLLCFEKRLWQTHPFKETGAEATVGDEAWWQLSIPEHAVFRYEFSIDPTLYCAFIHKLNTSNRQAPVGDPSWRPYGENLFSLGDLIGKDELALWEDAHAHVLIDPLVVGSVGGSRLYATDELVPHHLE